ncbi:MAG: tetratricopeptide repeat protein [Planctomycetota bacterium]|nr:MAG: tetratricopeptide repeat protein [Planctomycetota bacterium]
MDNEERDPVADIHKALEDPIEDVLFFLEDIMRPWRKLNKTELLLAAMIQEIDKMDDPLGIARLRLVAAVIYQSKYKYDLAEMEAENARKIRGLPRGFYVSALHTLSSVSISKLDYIQAEAYGKQALGLTEEGSTDGPSMAVMNLMGRVYAEQQKHNLSLEYFLEFKDICEKIGHREGYSIAINNLALAYNSLGRYAEGEKQLFEGLALAEKAEQKGQIGISNSNIASHFIAMTKFDEALGHAEKSLEVAKEIKDPKSICNRLVILGRIYRETGRPREALKHAQPAVAIAEDHDFQYILPAALRELGATFADLGEPEAILYLDRSIKLFLGRGDDEEPTGLELAYFEYGKLLVDKDRRAAAENLWKSIQIIKKRPLTPLFKSKLTAAENLVRELPQVPEFESASIEISQENLAKILDVSKAIISETELSGALEKILDVALEISGAERGVIWTKENGRLDFANAKNFHGELEKEPDYPAIVEISSKVAGSGNEFIAPGSMEVRKKMREFPSLAPMGVKSFFAFPLAVDDKTIGVLYLDSRFATIELSESIRKLLLSVMDQATMVLEKIRHLEAISRKSNRLQRKVRQQDNELKTVLDIVEKQKKELEERYGVQNIIGRSSKMRAVFELIGRAAESDLPVTIFGESGTGKELAARALHYGGPRKEKLFVPINCASIPENLLEAELFGYEKGAFTGAVESREGLFEVASGGTLMLDEIGDMSAQMQAKLLRVIEENRIRRIGGRHEIKVNARIVAASNKKLEDMVNAGTFRKDLFFRLNVINLTLPPLRERKDDIPILADHFWKKAGGDPGDIAPDGKREFMKTLSRYNWPGNVRELENEMERIIAFGGAMDVAFLSENIVAGVSNMLSAGGIGEESLNLEEMEIRLIEKALTAAKGNKASAARLMGIPKTSFYGKVKKYGIEWTVKRKQ